MPLFNRFNMKRFLKSCCSHLFWMAVRYVFKNFLNLSNFFDTRSGDFIEFSKTISSTPTFQKMKTPGGMKSTLSSIKRHNKRSTDAEFEGRARRELFKTSPVKFLMENDRFSKLPRRQRTYKFDSYISQQKRLRI